MKTKAKKLNQKELSQAVQVTIGADGIWLTIKTKSGKSFTFQPIQKFKDTHWQKYVLEWCKELQPLYKGEVI